MRRYFFYFLSILPFFGLDASDLDAFLRGQRAYDSGLYEEAVEAFQQALDECEEAEQADIAIRLAYSYFQSERDKEALDILQGLKESDETRLVTALAYKRLNDLTMARQLLTNCPHVEAKWHLGHVAYLQGDKAAAEAVWKELSSHDTWGPLSQLYLARLELDQHDFGAAKERLKAVASRLSSPLTYEGAFLLGRAEEGLEDWSAAVQAYQRALPVRNLAHAPWVQNTLRQLVHTNLAWAEQSQGQIRLRGCQQAEETARRLTHDFPGEASDLTLATCLVRKGRLLSDSPSLDEANHLLSQGAISHAHRNQTLLLRAEAASTYEARRFYFSELLQRQERESPEYLQFLSLSCQNDLQEGQLDAALERLQQSPIQSPEVRLEIGRLCPLIFAPETRPWGLEALAQLEESANDPDLPILLRGILLAQSDAEDPSPVWRSAVEKYPQGRYADECLRQLGGWQYRKGRYAEANQTYLDLVARQPASPICGEALYWAARAQENLGGDRSTVRHTLREVYENYPQSPYAAEAYLATYTYGEYVNDPVARTHLNRMKERFPDSPLIINAQHLLGICLRRQPSAGDKRKAATSRWHQAIEAFQEAESIYDRLYAAGMISDVPRYSTFRCRAKLERAMSNLAIATEAVGAKKRIYLGYTSDLFKELLAELDQAPWRNESLEPIREEASYGLAVTLLRGDDQTEAEQRLDSLLQQYGNRGVSRGYFLSRTLTQKGQLALTQGKPEEALGYLQQAEEAAKGNLLRPEERLDLWLLQSAALRALHRLDDAMLVLSKVINEDAISGLRIKALYQRAEIYQLQGRHELAQKQLEATARKGGEWALKAKEKLEREYGYQ